MMKRIPRIRIKHEPFSIKEEQTDDMVVGSRLQHEPFIKVEVKSECESDAHGDGDQESQSIFDFDLDCKNDDKRANDDIPGTGSDLMSETSSDSAPENGFDVVTKFNMNRHLASHTTQFPYQCSKCRQAFANVGEALVHEKTCRQRQYQCYLCNDDLPTITKLRHHMCLRHTAEKPFKCQVCIARFTRKGEANVHMRRVHSK